jgi:hypothetical protein
MDSMEGIGVRGIRCLEYLDRDQFVEEKLYSSPFIPKSKARCYHVLFVFFVVYKAYNQYQPYFLKIRGCVINLLVTTCCCLSIRALMSLHKNFRTH